MAPRAVCLSQRSHALRTAPSRASMPTASGRSASGGAAAEPARAAREARAAARAGARHADPCGRCAAPPPGPTSTPRPTGAGRSRARAIGALGAGATRRAAGSIAAGSLGADDQTMWGLGSALAPARSPPARAASGAAECSPDRGRGGSWACAGSDRGVRCPRGTAGDRRLSLPRPRRGCLVRGPAPAEGVLRPVTALSVVAPPPRRRRRPPRRERRSPRGRSAGRRRRTADSAGAAASRGSLGALLASAARRGESHRARASRTALAGLTRGGVIASALAAAAAVGGRDRRANRRDARRGESRALARAGCCGRLGRTSLRLRLGRPRGLTLGSEPNKRFNRPQKPAARASRPRAALAAGRDRRDGLRQHGGDRGLLRAASCRAPRSGPRAPGRPESDS